jgi:YebC/PmpR family DNA-binding regulatory protein
VGRSRRCLDHHGEKEVTFRSSFPHFSGSFHMSGHSKWASIKHKKGALDAKRGKIFTRIIKELTVAARNGGGDPDMNPRLRTVIADAKAANMPADNIKRAIRKGTGEEPGVSYEEAQYEAYGPGGAAVIIDVLTDNKNRTVGELRHMLEKHGGNLASTNAVAWMFNKKGYIVIEKAKADEEKLLGAVLDAGADDMQDDDDNWEVLSAPEAFQSVRDAVKQLGIEPASAQVSMIPQNYIKLEGKVAQQMLKLMESLDDQDDVQHVWSNFDISEQEIEASLA